MLRKAFASLVFAGMLATALPATAFADVGTTVLDVGSQGPDVQTLQQQLQKLGYFPVSEDTTQYFGPTTQQAVLAFKKDYNLSDGDKVGKTTEDTILKALTNHPQSTISSTDKIRNQVQSIAKNLIGTPYAWGGTTPSGFDCSGFTSYVFSQVGISLPRTSEDQYGNGSTVSKSALKPGDLVFFSTYDDSPSHVGIYLGDGKFIHAASEDVRIDSIDDPYYWGSRFIGAKSYIDAN